jgi:hypothetical protein
MRPPPFRPKRVAAGNSPRSRGLISGSCEQVAVLDQAPEPLRQPGAAGERIERGYLGSLLRLTLLAPDLVEAILDGRQPPELGLPRLMEPLPVAWTEQHQRLLCRCGLSFEVAGACPSGPFRPR